ncbi:MAG: response regulator [Candidatus Lokiarchaeota archaeon]|nr:response regulator [Candidatus Lokiarchaeota archaeon]
MSKVILIVDDNESLGVTMKKILEMKGHQAIFVDSGYEAIDTIKENDSIDAVFLDIKMPGINGVDVLREILKIREDLPVIMMTAYAVEDLIKESRLLGAYGVLTKPLDFDKIFTIIETTTQNNPGEILIVDDDESIRKTFQKILTSRGYKVIVAKSGEEALSVANFSTDIAFIDMRLPKMNGFETLIALRKKFHDLAIILLTGYYNEFSDLVRSSLKESAKTYFEKPIDMIKIFHTIDEIMSEKK